MTRDVVELSFELYRTRHVFTSQALPLIYGGRCEINMQKLVVLLLAMVDNPHLPNCQIFGKNATEHTVFALFLDEVLQVDYVRTPGRFDYEW
jgi:hypothetical protein